MQSIGLSKCYRSWRAGLSVVHDFGTTVDSSWVTKTSYERKNFHQLRKILAQCSKIEGECEIPVEILREICGKLSAKYAEPEISNRYELQPKGVFPGCTSGEAKPRQIVLSGSTVGYLLTCMDIEFSDGEIIKFIIDEDVFPLTKDRALLLLRHENYDDKLFYAVGGVIPFDEMPIVNSTVPTPLLVNCPWKHVVPVLPRKTRLLDASEVLLFATRQPSEHYESVHNLFHNRTGPHDKWFSGMGQLTAPIVISVDFKGEAKQVLGYTLQSANDMEARDPKSWILKGRPSGMGSEMMVIHQVTNFDGFKTRWDSHHFSLDETLPEMDAVELAIIEVRMNNGQGAQLGQFRISISSSEES